MIYKTKLRAFLQDFIYICKGMKGSTSSSIKRKCKYSLLVILKLVRICDFFQMVDA